MTTPINDFRDIIDAMERDPALKDALHRHILTNELLLLPVEFQAFREEIRAFTEEMTTFEDTQTKWNENADAHLNRMEGDISGLKGDYARSQTIRGAQGIAKDMGLEYVRTLSRAQLGEMAGGNLPTETDRSFRNADQVFEATDGEQTIYTAMEISFTAHRRDVDRATRNANLISEFTGRTSRAAVARVKNDRATAEAVEAGTVYWHPLENRTPTPK